MSNKCFIPNCKNSVGVQFPTDSELTEKWLEGLNLINAVVKPESFVCLVHFAQSDLKEGVPGKKVSSLLKQGAVPCNPQPFLGDHNEDLLEETKTTKEICRACRSNQDLEASMFDFIEDNVLISSAFMMCVFPIEVSKQDHLPKKICKSCLESLNIAYKFRKNCIETDSYLKSNCKENSKRKTDDDNVRQNKKFCESLQTQVSSDIPTTSALDYSDTYELVYEDNECRQEPKLKSHNSNLDEIEKNMEEIHGNSLKQIEAKNAYKEEETEEDDDKLDFVSNKERRSNENTVEDILNTLEEDSCSSRDSDVIKEFFQKSTERSLQVSKPSVKKKIVVKSNFPINTKKEVTIPLIKLPKDVKIKPVQYSSETGVFQGLIRTGVYDSTFVQADEYLFELGLAKSLIRYLRCVVPTCSAQGKVKFFANGDIDSTVEIMIPHNHPAPNESAKKKQMFLCLMRKKMQTDRTLNIRNIYEDACIQDPDIKQLVPLRNVINEICRHQLAHKTTPINSFKDFFYAIETDSLEKLHFTHNSQQFYQEKFFIKDDDSMAVLFGNMQIISEVSDSKIMYVDASFKIDTTEDFKYQLVTVLVWIDDSYYPILFTVVNKKSQLIFRKIFAYLHDQLAPTLRPQEIITDYEANLYYALAEVYVDSNIGGSVFYYTQNLYKKICSLNLSRDLETNSYFRNIYHMLLMLPLLPVNTVLDGLNNIELEAKNLNISELTRPIFDHIRLQWILNVTPELFCVHKLENRINENVIAPFKKLRDFLLLTKGKLQKTQITIMYVIEKIVELEAFLRELYSKPDKKSFGRDLSSYQKKNVLRAWQYIEDHPKIEMNSFFSKVLGYIKCMENQLWIWGFYCYNGDTDDILINSSHFSIVSPSRQVSEDVIEDTEDYLEYIEDNTIVMEAVVDQDGVLQTGNEIIASEDVVTTSQPQEFESAFLNYVYQQ